MLNVITWENVGPFLTFYINLKVEQVHPLPVRAVQGENVPRFADLS